MIHSVTTNILHTTKTLKCCIHVNLTIWQQPHSPYVQEWFYHTDCPLSTDTHKYANISVTIYCLLEVYIWSIHCTTEIGRTTSVFEKSSWLAKKMNHNVIYIQGVSRLVDITAGGDFLGLCDKKSSYKHVSDFGRLRSYWHFLIPVHALLWTALWNQLAGDVLNLVAYRLRCKLYFCHLTRPPSCK